MKIILGVDGEAGEPSLAAPMLRRLRFALAAIDVVHVLTPLPYVNWGLDTIVTSEDMEAAQSEMREWAQDLVDQTAQCLRTGKPLLPEEADPTLVRTLVQYGISIPDCLLETADQRHADLIAVDGPHSGPLGAILAGSVARALVIGSKRSLLLTKDPDHGRGKHLKLPTPAKLANHGVTAEEASPGVGKLVSLSPDRPVRAVFATDHSPYANRCLKTLLGMAPGGISHLTVLTAYPEQELLHLENRLPHLALPPSTAIRQSLTAHNERVLQRLAPLLEANSAMSASRVVGTPVNQAIAQTMEEEQAELLILGARGHSFADRLVLGSVSFHQAMTSPYSLLILRP